MRLSILVVVVMFLVAVLAPAAGGAATNQAAVKTGVKNTVKSTASVTNRSLTNQKPGSTQPNSVTNVTNRQPVAPEEKPEPLRYNHLLTVNGGLFLSPLNAVQDPYPFGLGFGFTYGMFWFGNLVSVPGLFLALDFDMHFFQPKEEFKAFFGDSTLIMAGISAGYQLLFGKPRDATQLALALTAGYRQYFSSHVYSVTSFRDTTFPTSQPAAAAGLELNLYKDFMVISARLEYLMIFETTLLHALVPSLRLGFVF